MVVEASSSLSKGVEGGVGNSPGFSVLLEDESQACELNNMQMQRIKCSFKQHSETAEAKEGDNRSHHHLVQVLSQKIIVKSLRFRMNDEREDSVDT